MRVSFSAGLRLRKAYLVTRIIDVSPVGSPGESENDHPSSSAASVSDVQCPRYPDTSCDLSKCKPCKARLLAEMTFPRCKRCFSSAHPSKHCPTNNIAWNSSRCGICGCGLFGKMLLTHRNAYPYEYTSHCSGCSSRNHSVRMCPSEEAPPDELLDENGFN